MQPEFSDEDVKIVNRILEANTIFDVLGINDEFMRHPEWSKKVKKLYRKLSLQVHPDKNNAPKAGEAFGILNASYSRLLETHTNYTIRTQAVTRQTQVTPQHTDPFINEWLQKMYKNRAAKGAATRQSNYQNNVPKKEPKMPCQAKTKDEEPCKKSAKPGEKYCGVHVNYDPNAKKEPKIPSIKCTGFTKEGNPCQSYAMKGQLFCKRHQKT